MKKTLFTLNINNYEPDITALTFPLMKRYAEKIEADFHVITERKITTTEFAGLEKFQIYELGREMKNDWNIFVDPDAADIVFNADVKKVIIPLDVCNDVFLSMEDFEQLKDSSLYEPIKKMMGFYIEGIQKFICFRRAIIKLSNRI